MKCPAVACLWPPSSPSHRISAVAVLHHPLSLFTGDSGGAIVRWTFSGDHVRPLALLCGHTAEIVDLAPCFPDAVEPFVSSSTHSSTPHSSILSACKEGVLCVWSSGSFRCLRRRKLPIWAGTPSHLVEIRSSPRHVCIECSYGEGSKSSVLIVDSGTLLVVRTVFHGSLCIGSVKSMAIVPPLEGFDKEKESVFLVDGNGKTQFWALSKEYGGVDGEGSVSMNRISTSDSLTSVWGESSSNNDAQAAAVAVAQDGNLLALIYEFRCEFRSVLNGAVMGEIYLGSNDSHPNLNLEGGVFLHRVVNGNISKTDVFDEDSQWTFALWYSDGSAMVYILSILDALVNYVPICEVPAEHLNNEGQSLFHFCQLNDSLVRLGSMSFSHGDLLVWRPSITIWSIIEINSSIKSEHSNCSSSILIREGGFSSIPFCSKKNVDVMLKDSLQQRVSLDTANLSNQASLKAENDSNLDDRIVSCSVVFSDEIYPQYAIIYGFYSGEIEMNWLVSQCQNVNYMKDDSLQYSKLHASECFFLGHTGAVLCLAIHRVIASSNNLVFHRILLSGSMDCTVRLWDLDSGSLLLVLHHHVAPVKQIMLPPAWTNRPWNDCFLSVGEDGCVALISLETLRVERMFVGHPSYPSVVAWDSRRGYLACLCRSTLTPSEAFSALYLWDVKTGTRERIIRGSASHSMLDHFCRGINRSTLGGATSASPLILPIIDDSSFSQSQPTRTDVRTGISSRSELSHSSMKGDFAESCGYSTDNNKKKLTSLSRTQDNSSDLVSNNSSKHATFQHVAQIRKHPIMCSCPFPGVASFEFDLSTLVSLHCSQNNEEQTESPSSGLANVQLLHKVPPKESSVTHEDESTIMKEALEGYLLRFSLCFLHLWDTDLELDKLLREEMDVHKPDGFEIAAGILGDGGSMTLMFPGHCASLELWKSSSEYCAMRSLIIVSLAQCMISLCHSTTAASSALAAFYTRNFAEKVPDLKPPLLQLLVSFWQDPSEHVRMAARSLFHCAASRSIPDPLYAQLTVYPGAFPSSVKVNDIHSENDNGNTVLENSNMSKNTDCEIVSWLESFEIHEWISCIGGTNQDAMASHIIVAAALVVWYPSKVKSNLAKLVANRLLKLVMSMNDRFSSTAAELLAEGMESSWKSCLEPDIPRLIGDILFQIECLFGMPSNSVKQSPSLTADIRESLVGILLPSLALADITGFLNVIEDQIWSTSSDSPVHLVSLKTLIRIVRSSPKPLALYLDKVVNYVLQTMDPSNLIMRRVCLTSSLLALKEIVRVLPMVALNESTTRLAIGDAIGDISNVTIRVYDVESVTKVKILDASTTLGLPSLLERTSKARMATAISALSFSPDGEGLVAFSENGLMLRWWSLGTAWWEKISRSFVPVHCTKLIFIPPWEGFSPNSSRSSIMANIVTNDGRADSEEKTKELDEADMIRLLLHNLDLSYRLQWIVGRNVLLTRHGQELGTFPM